MSISKIEWTEKTWNPVTGCTKVSQGCKFCYAERLFPRVYGKDVEFTGKFPKTRRREFSDIRLHNDRLEQPLHWKKPAMIFVNSMSDLFHENIPDVFIIDCLKVMHKANWHTFQILTKRPARARIFLHSRNISFMPNVWIGVSVENQTEAYKRIPELLRIPAHTKFLSCEPLLDELDLQYYLNGGPERDSYGYYYQTFKPIDWVIVGGESGGKARPMNIEWAISIKDQCKAANVPFFFKQGSQNNWINFKNFASFPKELQIREYPKTNKENNNV